MKGFAVLVIVVCAASFLATKKLAMSQVGWEARSTAHSEVEEAIDRLYYDDGRELKRLLDNGLNPDSLISQSDGNQVTLLQHALSMGNQGAVRMLASRGASWSKLKGNKRVLLLFAANIDANYAVELMKLGYDPNQTEIFDKTTVLHVLAKDPEYYQDINRSFAGSFEELKTFRKNQQFEISNRRRNTVQCAEWMIDHGANVNLKDDMERTPLHIAAENIRETAFLKLLIRKGARVNEIDREGRSPLDVAVLNLNTDAAKILLKAGGKQHSKRGGKIAKDQVGDIAGLLRKYGAKDAQ